MSLRLDVNVDQNDGASVIVETRVLGPHPYVLVQMLRDPENPSGLLVSADIGGREEQVSGIGTVLRILGTAIEKQGDDLTAQAKASKTQQVTAHVTVPGAAS